MKTTGKLRNMNSLLCSIYKQTFSKTFLKLLTKRIATNRKTTNHYHYNDNIRRVFAPPRWLGPPPLDRLNFQIVVTELATRKLCTFSYTRDHSYPLHIGIRSLTTRLLRGEGSGRSGGGSRLLPPPAPLVASSIVCHRVRRAVETSQAYRHTTASYYAVYPTLPPKRP